MSGEEILDRIENEIVYCGEENIHQIILYGTKDVKVSPDFERLREKYCISGIEYQTESRWDYEKLSKEDDLLIQNVAEILKEKPQALSYAMELCLYPGRINMKIQEISIDGFGKFHKYHTYFADGIQVIYGKNETGKTTLRQFMIAMLFGLEKGRGLAAKK